MTKETKTKLKDNQQEAVEFTATFRGQYIISQALVKAIAVMKAVPEPMTERSNIADMEYLVENLFNIFPQVEGTADDDQAELWKGDDDAGR